MLVSIATIRRGEATESAARAGLIASSSGKATVTPDARRNVRRDSLRPVRENGEGIRVLSGGLIRVGG